MGNMELDLNVVLEQRRKIEKRLFRTTEMNVMSIADYFEIPERAVKSDLKSLGISDFDSKKNKTNYRTIEALKKQRDRSVSRELENGASEKEVLEATGLTSIPASIGVQNFKDLEVPEDIPEDRRKIIRSAFILSQKGLTVSGLCAYFGLSDVEELILKQQGAMEFKKEGLREDALTYLNSGNDPYVISEAIGYPVSNMIKPEINKDGSRRVNKTRDIQRAQTAQRKAEKNQIMEDVYNRWISGECTQQELADEYDVNRMTIINWCRKKKLEHMAERIETGEAEFVRRRNIRSDQKEIRDTQKAKVIEAFEKNPSASYSEISRLTGVHGGKVKTFLVGEDLVRTKYEQKNTSAIDAIKRVAVSGKRSEDTGFLGQFSYGVNRNTTKMMSHSEHAQMINDHHHLESERRRNKAVSEMTKNGTIEKYLLDKRKKIVEEEMQRD